MEVKANEARSARDRQMGIQRQSERAHTFLFVTDGFTAAPVPPQADRTWLMIGVLFAGLLLAGGLLRLSWRESKKKDLVYDSVRKLRESRHALTMKQKSAKSEAEALPSAPETPPDQPAV
jgi:hypothetical protein